MCESSDSSFGLKTVGIPMQRRIRLHHLQERKRGMRKTCLPSIHEPQLTLDLQFRYLHPHECAALKLRPHGQSRDKRNTVAHLHKSLDRLERWQFNAHLQRSLMSFECLDDLL